MNSLERVKCAARCEQPDVVPAAPFIGSMAARFAGVSIRDYVTKGAVIAKAQIQLCEALGSDMVFSAADAYYMAEGFGLQTTLHDDALPTANSHLLQDLREAEKCIPVDPYTGGRMPVYLDAISEMAAKVKGEIAIRGTGTGPFSIAGFLLGTNNLLEKLIDIENEEAENWEEGAIRHLLDIAAQTCADFISAQVRLGADIAYIGDSLCSNDMISPAMYRSYVFPYHKWIVDSVRPICEQYGASVVLHSCGNNTAVLDDFVQTGINMLDIDSVVDLAHAKGRIGREVCICGNLNPVSVMNGPPEDIRAEAALCLENAAANGGFILSTGCFVAETTPVENLKAIVDAAHSYRYAQ